MIGCRRVNATIVVRLALGEAVRREVGMPGRKQATRAAAKEVRAILRLSHVRSCRSARLLRG